MKRIVLMMALMAGVLGAQAQHEVGTWSVMPKVGANLSKLSEQEMIYEGFNSQAEANAKYKFGLTAGAEAEYQAWQQVAVSAGVFYSNEGYTYGKIKDMEKLSQSLHFVSVPLLLNFYIEPNLLPGLALKAGVQLGYLLSAKQHYGSVTNTVTDNYKRVNVSIPAGISYTYRGFTADFRYNIGVANLCNVDVIDRSWRTGSFWLTLGYQFVL